MIPGRHRGWFYQALGLPLTVLSGYGHFDKPISLDEVVRSVRQLRWEILILEQDPEFREAKARTHEID